jgi:hypothetical protein
MEKIPLFLANHRKIKLIPLDNLPKAEDWNASGKDGCVHVVISEKINIEGSKLKFLGKDREPLIEMKLNYREVHICMQIGNPLFVELHTKGGVSVRYVTGSGQDFYKKI